MVYAVKDTVRARYFLYWLKINSYWLMRLKLANEKLLWMRTERDGQRRLAKEGFGRG